MCGEQALSDLCFEVIDDPNREFVASDFLRLELLPKPIFNGKEESVNFYNEYISSVSKMIETNPEAISSAFGLAATFGLSAFDALHFQAAIEAGASEFITTEKPTKPFFNINHESVKAISLRSKLA